MGRCWGAAGASTRVARRVFLSSPVGAPETLKLDMVCDSEPFMVAFEPCLATIGGWRWVRKHRHIPYHTYTIPSCRPCRKSAAQVHLPSTDDLTGDSRISLLLWRAVRCERAKQRSPCKRCAAAPGDTGLPRRAEGYSSDRRDERREATELPRSRRRRAGVDKQSRMTLRRRLAVCLIAHARPRCATLRRRRKPPPEELEQWLDTAASVRVRATRKVLRRLCGSNKNARWCPTEK